MALRGDVLRTSCMRTVASLAASATAAQGRVSPLTATFQPRELSRARPKACAQCCTGKDSSLVRPRLSCAASKAERAASCSPPYACIALRSENVCRGNVTAVPIASRTKISHARSGSSVRGASIHDINGLCVLQMVDSIWQAYAKPRRIQDLTTHRGSTSFWRKLMCAVHDTSGVLQPMFMQGRRPLDTP